MISLFYARRKFLNAKSHKPHKNKANGSIPTELRLCRILRSFIAVIKRIEIYQKHKMSITAKKLSKSRIISFHYAYLSSINISLKRQIGDTPRKK